MDFNTLREYIIAGDIIPQTIYNGENIDAVFLLEKPHEIEADNYLVYTFNRLNGGEAVQHYSVTLSIVGVYPLDVLTYKDSLIALLDFYNRPCAISGLAKFRLSHESGIYYDDNINRYIDKLIFDCKYI